MVPYTEIIQRAISEGLVRLGGSPGILPLHFAGLGLSLSIRDKCRVDLQLEQ